MSRLMKHRQCICGSFTCKHYNMINEKLVEKDHELQILKMKYGSEDVEHFKDMIIEKNTKAFLEDGMY